MPVEIITLEAKPVEQTSEFVAAVKSRRSATIQPEVEGALLRIAVRSGQNVSRGALLFEIDSAPQQSALSALQSSRAARESDVEFARQQVTRNKTLLTAGAISQREVEQFEAQLRGLELRRPPAGWKSLLLPKPPVLLSGRGRRLRQEVTREVQPRVHRPRADVRQHFLVRGVRRDARPAQEQVLQRHIRVSRIGQLPVLRQTVEQPLVPPQLPLLDELPGHHRQHRLPARADVEKVVQRHGVLGSRNPRALHLYQLEPRRLHRQHDQRWYAVLRANFFDSL